MKNKDGNTKIKMNLPDLLAGLQESAKKKKVSLLKEELKTEELPTVEELLEQYYTHGTRLQLKYQEKEIIFNNPLSPVKSLQVNICSTETQHQTALHKLHTLTRSA